ncbi:hypothetical protein EG338_08350 [Kaistella haifensis]|jgi:hypothetical protein|uniref:hypothetical protein n=1 Tax=Chryseobacterium sp. 5_R23647 TaxID=2258964 RepID=UPI000E22F7F7|nr:hypothetical protein [Chryseobacterium sp. 5_R23647]AZB22074.1 hypothetical protein EG338_08350 [Kaistella haifensis]REC41500.1 hypothetical protein DRF69_14990 [Chryseobacterium sp. 5_R23647]
MQTEHLPTEDLKKFGIINEDLSFSKNLKADDIQKFLQGYTIVADNDKNRATFQLTDNNTKLKVIFLERDKSISKIIENSKERIEYSTIQNLSESTESKLSLEKKAFIYDRENNIVSEFDLIRNARELTAIIADKKDVVEINRYKTELQKLKNFLMDKIDQYPEIAKEIEKDINIVSREINTVNRISRDEKQISKRKNSEVQLNVNDKDLYEDANRNRDEQKEELQEREKPRGFRR